MTPTSPAFAAPGARGPSRAISLLREVPAGRRRLVARDRLVRRLLATDAVRVVLLRGPAGYGKTTLLEAWGELDPRRFLWLAPGRGPLRRSRWAAELIAIAESPERLPAPSVLVIDGWDAGAGPAVCEALAHIADRVPPGSLLVLATRSEAPLRVGRLRVQHEVLELGPRDLAMTHAETAELLDAAGVALTRDGLDAIVQRSEGWPAALSLAALSLAGEPDADAAAAHFSGRDPFIADYVRDELLGHVAKDSLDFLLGTSMLETLESGLCDTALATQGSAAMLNRLARSELPLTRVDRDDGRLRCHPLLREALQDELRRRTPDKEAGVHRLASRWFEERDEPGRAVEHALAGGDLDRAQELLWRLAPTYAWDARRPLLQGWLGAVPSHLLERRPALALSMAMCQLAGGAFIQARHWATLAAESLDDAPAALRSSLEVGLAAVEAVATGLPPAGPEPASDAQRALYRLAEGGDALRRGDEARASALLEDGIVRGAISAPGVAALCEAELALGALCRDDWEQGATLAERARSRAGSIGLDDHPSMALVTAVSAFARAHRGRFEEARADARDTRGLLAGLAGNGPWFEAQALLALGRAELRLSDITAARALLTDAAREARRLPDTPALSAWIAAGRARLDGSGGTPPPTPDPLTAAELRVLRFLPSHLSFREIGVRLHVSSNTIKTQAHAIYRKLGASPRSAAVERARSLGLLDTA